MPTKIIDAYLHRNAVPEKVSLSYELINSLYKVELILENKKAIGTGTTLYDALIQIRSVIEPHGWLLGVNASRKDAGPVIKSEGGNSESISIISGIDHRTSFALESVPLEFLDDIHHQRQFFDEELIKMTKIKENQKYLKSVKRKAGTTGDNNRYLPFLAIFITLFSIAYSPLVYLLGPAAWEVLVEQGYGNIHVFGALIIIFGISLYAIAVCVAIENIFIVGKTSINLFFSIAGPIIVTIITTYFWIVLFTGEVAKNIADTMSSIPL
jgi:hypothetical protein